MGFKNRLDRLKSTRLGKPSKHDSAEKEEMAEKYSKKKSYHHKHNADKTKSTKEQILKSVMNRGKKFVQASKEKAQAEAIRQSKKKSKKSKTKKLKPESREVAYSNDTFDFGFGMFNPQPTKESEPKEVDWSRIYNFRMESDSKRRKYNPFGSFYP
jgi:hypothetical protein